jgi:hypothetical protein
MKKQLLERLKKTEADLMQIIGQDKTEEDLTLLKTEVGMDYLVKRYGYKHAQQIWKSPLFWAWWQIIWHLNNCDIVDFLTIEVENDNMISWYDYGQAQLAKAIHKYNLTARELKDIEAHAPQEELQLLTT